MLAVRKDTIYFLFTAYFLIKKEHPAVSEMLLIEFTNHEHMLLFLARVRCLA